jgi:mRNA-degrading endonuclease RelE of RelBE toxin-antitoxin system
VKWEVLWYQDAVEEIQQLSARNSRQATRIVLAVRELGRSGRGDMKKLADHAGVWRLRAGDWRVFFRFVGPAGHVTGIRDRQDAY